VAIISLWQSSRGSRGRKFRRKHGDLAALEFNFLRKQESRIKNQRNFRSRRRPALSINKKEFDLQREIAMTTAGAAKSPTPAAALLARAAKRAGAREAANAEGLRSSALLPLCRGGSKTALFASAELESWLSGTCSGNVKAKLFRTAPRHS
jgi:hypothetical protein